VADSVICTTHPNRCQYEQGREAVGRQGRGLSSPWVRFAVADGLQGGLAFANPHPTTNETMKITISLQAILRLDWLGLGFRLDYGQIGSNPLLTKTQYLSQLRSAGGAIPTRVRLWASNPRPSARNPLLSGDLRNDRGGRRRQSLV
jgi:hypothetical protein